MKDIRIGNDILVTWELSRNGEIFSLEGKAVSVYLKSAFERTKLTDFTVSGNIVFWTFFGKDQKRNGIYSLELVINEGSNGMITTDACDFVRLVSCSCKLQGGEDAPNVETESIELTSTLEYVAGGMSEEEVLNLLDGKVDKVEGLGLSEENYTADEKEKLAGLENYDDSGIKDELAKKAEKSEIPTKMSQLEQDIEVGESYDDTEVKSDIKDLQDKKADKSELTELSLEVSGLSEKIDNLPSAESSVFEAVYGETTYNEIIEAHNEGKIVICEYDVWVCRLTKIQASQVMLQAFAENSVTRLVCKSNGQWANATYSTYHNLKTLDNGNCEITIAAKTAEVATPQYVENAIQQSGEKNYELLLDTTFEEDVESFNASAVAPRLLECKDFIVLIEFLYDENKKNRSGYILFKNGSSLPSARIESVVTASYLTHYILRIHLGQGFDKTASIESHTNDFANPQYGTPKGNIMGVRDSDNPWDRFDFQFGFFANEKIRIYGK